MRLHVGGTEAFLVAYSAGARLLVEMGSAQEVDIPTVEHLEEQEGLREGFLVEELDLELDSKEDWVQT